MVAPPQDGTNSLWWTVAAIISHPQPQGLWGLSSSRQTKDQLGYSWFLVRGWAWGQEVQKEEGLMIKKREKLARRFWKAVTFSMMSAFPITALTQDPQRWFNGGILFLLTSPFFPSIKTENIRAGTRGVWKCGQAAKIYYSPASSPVSLSDWFCHSVSLNTSRSIHSLWPSSLNGFCHILF